MAKEYEARRDEILDAAETLFLTKSYSETSVEDVLQAVGIAKGTLYYYFKSKRDLLDSLIDRMVAEVADIYRAATEDKTLNAVEKLYAIYRLVGLRMQDGKDARILRTVLSQDPNNAEMWHYIKTKSMRTLPPLLSKVIDEGIEQGLFSPACPAHELGEIIIHMVLSLRESIGMVLASYDREEAVRAIQARVKAYARCVESILGMEAGVLGDSYAGAMNRFVKG